MFKDCVQTKGYDVRTRWVRGVRLRWIASSVAWSRSLVTRHWLSPDGHRVEMGERFGLTVKVGNRMCAWYTERAMYRAIDSNETTFVLAGPGELSTGEKEDA